jgi:glycerol-3-phosphate acyltransferase PlsY
MYSLSFVVLLSYLLGSIPTSLIFSKLKGGIDIRNFGSGNAGGTNVVRLFGWKLGIFVMLLDALKGAVAILVVARVMYDVLPFKNYTPFDDFTVVQIIAGVSAIVGHIWSVFADFRGGKGIATACGVLLALAPIESGISLGVFSLVFTGSKYISLGSISAAVSLPLVMLVRHNIFEAELTGYNTLIYVSTGITMLLLFTHGTNIKRLIAGTENRLTRISHKHTEANLKEKK